MKWVVPRSVCPHCPVAVAGTLLGLCSQPPRLHPEHLCALLPGWAQAQCQAECLAWSSESSERPPARARGAAAAQGVVCSAQGHRSEVGWPHFCAFPATPSPGASRTFRCCLFLVYAARIDMIVGPPPPSTPRHKKYPTKGPTAPPRESPQYSPRSGHSTSSQPVFVNGRPLRSRLHDGGPCTALARTERRQVHSF